MRRTALPSLLAFAALTVGACLPGQAQAQTPTPTQMTPQAGAPTPQQARKAQQNRSDAEAYLQREEAAANGSRNAATGSAATSPTRADPDAPPPYGPVLDPRQSQSDDPARRNPAEVHDEADSGANPAVQPQQGARRNNPQTSRHPAWQAPAEPMAPRLLRRNGVDPRATAANPEPVPAPATAPQPVVPTSSALNGCIGGSCTDAAGTRYNGIGNSGSAGVSASGRLCNRSGATVQCF